jgi:hypothetical protein
MSGFRFSTSPAADGSRQRRFGVALAIAATAAAVSAGMLLNHIPHSAAATVEPGATQVASRHTPAADRSLPYAARVINAIAGNPDPDAPMF